MKSGPFLLKEESTTQAFAAALAQVVPRKCICYLSGDLGAGKTSFTRAFIHAKGYNGKVKSPTYALVESYDITGALIYHFDLYRLSHPEELHFIGVDDYLRQDAIVLVEWPAQGQGAIPDPDLHLYFSHQNEGRLVRLLGASDVGEKILSDLNWES